MTDPNTRRFTALMAVIAQLLLSLERRELMDPTDTAELLDEALGKVPGAEGEVAVLANLVNRWREGSGTD